MTPFRIGTRGSTLARWQAERVRALLAAQGTASTLLTIRTSGDEGAKRPAAYVDGKGLFTKELEDALLEGRIDAAVHSLKDLGAVLPDGLELVAYPEREDPSDALVTREGGAAGALLGQLRRGGVVGTSSLRRVAQLLAHRPDLEVVPLRGNVPTRLARVERGELDGAVLAMAGLKRLGLAARATPLSLTEFVPAAGQGALAVQIRSEDAAARGVFAALDDPRVRLAVEAERAAMAELEGGCRLPLGAICLPLREPLNDVEMRGEVDAPAAAVGWVLYCRVYTPDGRRLLAAQVAVDPADPRSSGIAAARRLLDAGAADLIRFAAQPSPTAPEVPGR